MLVPDKTYGVVFDQHSTQVKEIIFAVIGFVFAIIESIFERNSKKAHYQGISRKVGAVMCDFCIAIGLIVIGFLLICFIMIPMLIKK